MRVWWVVLLAGVVACKEEAPRGPKLVTRIPHVEAPEAVAAEAPDSLAPALIVFVAADGSLAVTAGPAKWSALTAYAPPRALEAVTANVLEAVVLEADAFGKRARNDLASIAERMRPAKNADDDPPPPEDENMDLDELPPDEESGPSDGAIPEKKQPPRPPRPLSTRGRVKPPMEFEVKYGPPPGGAGAPGWWPPRSAFPAPKPRHIVDAIGEPAPTVLSTQAVVAVEPSARASALIEAVAASEGSILVEHAGRVRVLRVQFAFERELHDFDHRRFDGPFIEVHVRKEGFQVEAVTSPPTKLDRDVTALVKAIAAKAQLRRFRNSPVDLLVTEDIRAQELVDLIIALDRAGITSIGIGRIGSLDEKQAKLRGKWLPTLKVATPTIRFANEKGLSDEARSQHEDEIRRALKDVGPILRTCYERALDRNPEIEGDATLVFATDQTGNVTKSSSEGVEEQLGQCLAEAMKTRTYAKRAAKGLIETTLTITMRPAADNRRP